MKQPLIYDISRLFYYAITILHYYIYDSILYYLTIWKALLLLLYTHLKYTDNIVFKLTFKTFWSQSVKPCVRRDYKPDA